MEVGSRRSRLGKAGWPPESLPLAKDTGRPMNAFPEAERPSSPAPASTLALCEDLGRRLRSLAATPGDLGLLETVLLAFPAIPVAPWLPALAKAQHLAGAGLALLEDLRGGLLPPTAQAIELLFETEELLGALAEDLSLHLRRQGTPTALDSADLLARLAILRAEACRPGPGAAQA